HTRLAPGAESALRHTHTRQDEFVYVLEGRPTLVTNDGELQLEPGMCVGFKAGDGNAHHIVNRSSADVVLIEVCDRTKGDGGTSPTTPSPPCANPTAPPPSSTKAARLSCRPPRAAAPDT